ncbi:MAG: ribonuclease HII [Verrucomicrobiota bacterium]
MNALQKHDARLLENCEVVVGVDEAGRGALAGPVSAGACVFRRNFFSSEQALKLSAQVNDSKQLSTEARGAQFEAIQRLQAEGLLDFAVAAGSVEEIAVLNILGATRLAMRRAIETLSGRAKHWSLKQVAEEGPLFAASAKVRLIVDGRPLRPFAYAHTGIVGGDGKSLAIAVASIAAKVTRDRELVRLAEEHPEYGFEVHKGYGTKAHREAILEYGPSPVHRELFLRKILPSSEPS